MIIKARVKINQKQFSVERGDVWAISVRATPEKGTANLEILKELGKKYKNVKILRGLKSRKKTIFLGPGKV